MHIKAVRAASFLVMKLGHCELFVYTKLELDIINIHLH